MASLEEPVNDMQVPQREDKMKQFESLIGPLLSHWNPISSFKMDDFQLTLFDLLSTASDEGIQQYAKEKQTDLYKFMLTIFIATLHGKNPLRLTNDDNLKLQNGNYPKNDLNAAVAKKNNPLNSLLVSPAHTLPPPPKRRNSDSNKPQNGDNNKQQNDDKNKQEKNDKNMPESDFLRRNLSNIDERKEKDRYSLKQINTSNINTNHKNNNHFDITPLNSDDNLISHKNKNFFDDILLTDNSQNADISKTYETYDGEEFFTQRTMTAREHTTTERFQCNPKEKAFVDEWRRLLHTINTPEPASFNDHLNDEDNKNGDDKNDDDKDSPVLVPSAAEIKSDQDDDDTILIEPCEMIAPMTRIRGKFKLTSTSITFIPDSEQDDVTNSNEINLATNPPPLPLSPQMTASSTKRARSSSYGLLKKPAAALLNQSHSNAAPSVSASAHVSETGTPPNPTLNGKTVSFNLKEDENKNDIIKDAVPQSPRSQLENMVLSSTTLSNGIDGSTEKQYWVTTNVCSSYQQVGGTRYRLMTAHRFWFIDELKEIYYRRYQLRNCAFELFFSDDTSWFFNCYDEENRNKIFNKIMALSPTNLIESREYFQNPKKAIKTSQIHYKWCRREITNFEYLMRLNTLAGRTFNDLTQYPVVPWVITDFESDKLDLNDEKSYRDLSKPIGALNEERLNKFKSRYESLLEDYNLSTSDEEKSMMHCFMYGTHYSSIGICLYYLLRMQPFTTYNLKFQGGKFDQPDRLFYSILETFKGCLNNTSDVKELIPEFYYLTDFLSNKQSLDLGHRQNNKNEIVNDVILPPWAKNSPEKFIKIMREALESEYVSSNLHHWIDLIFGQNQRGDKAAASNNVFHPYTYQGNVNIEDISDPTERKAILAQIDEFGQTPLQLFTKEHPKRLKKSEVLTTVFKAKSVKYYGRNNLTDSNDVGISSISWYDKSVIIIGSDCCIDTHKWEPNKLSIEKKKKNSSFNKIMKMATKKKHNKIGSTKLSSKIKNQNLCFATTKDGLYVFACGFEDNSIVVWDVTHSKPYQGITKHHDIVSCLALDENIEKQKAILVTGSYDKSVMVWRININANKSNKTKLINNKSGNKFSKTHKRKQSFGGGKLSLNELIDPNPTHILDNQLAPVSCVDISLKSGIITCCSLDGMVNVYNVSTGEHYHMLQPYVDKAMKKEQILQARKEKKLENERRRSSTLNNNNDNEEKEIIEISPSPNIEPLKEGNQNGVNKNKLDLDIENGELSIVRVSSVFGHVLCYSAQTKDLFIYSSAGELLNYSTSRDDIYNDIVFSKSGNYIACGGKNHILRIKELPSFKTRKKFEDAKKSIKSIYLDKDETYMLVGCKNGDVLVYSLPQKAFVKSRVHTLTELGF